MAVRTKSKDRAIAVSIVKATNETQHALLQRWAQSLLNIRSSDGSRFDKTKRAVQATIKSDALIPLVKLLAKETQRLGWNERGLAAKIAIAAALATLVTTGGSGAGIAALGGAVGVPLWIVFGAGGAFLGVLLEELQKSRLPPPVKRRLKPRAVPARKRLPGDDDIIDVPFVEVSAGTRSKPKAVPTSKTALRPKSASAKAKARAKPKPLP